MNSWKEIIASISKLAVILFSWWIEDKKNRKSQKAEIYKEAKEAFKNKDASGVTIAFDKLRNVR